jgi:hypothetical protein
MQAFLFLLAFVGASTPCDCFVREVNELICNPFIEEFQSVQKIGLQSRLFPRTNEIVINRDLLFCNRLRDDIQNGIASIATVLTETLIFTKITKSEVFTYSEDDEECPICLASFDKNSLKAVNCGHVFHSHCLSECLKSRPSSLRTECPTCRHDFLEKPIGDVWKSDRKLLLPPNQVICVLM